jgi:GxxExxY protein
MISEVELRRFNVLTERIIGCAIEVHRNLGPGLLEQTYEAAMCVEMGHRQITFERQALFPIGYKGIKISEHRVDLIVERCVVVELKSVDRYDPVFMAQILTYLRCTGLKVGLLINFHGRVLRSGVRRFLLDHLRAL